MVCCGCSLSFSRIIAQIVCVVVAGRRDIGRVDGRTRDQYGGVVIVELFGGDKLYSGCCNKIWQDLYVQRVTTIKQVVDHNLIGQFVRLAINSNGILLKANIEINCESFLGIFICLFSFLFFLFCVSVFFFFFIVEEWETIAVSLFFISVSVEWTKKKRQKIHVYSFGGGEESTNSWERRKLSRFHIVWISICGFSWI